MPWWLAVSVLFILGRIVSTLMLLWFAAHQAENPWTGANPSLWDFSTIWDGHWYYIIAETGYPSELPTDGDGHITENAWAFLPLYPFTVRLVMMLTGLGWPIAAVLVSTVCALAATLIVYRLFARVLDRGQAFFATALFTFAPVAAVYQVAYAESMQLLLIAIALLLLLERRYLGIIPVALLLGVTRPGALALALTLGLHFVYRWFTRARTPFPGKERARLIVTGLVTALAGCEWLLIAAAVTGTPDAYVRTELAWRSVYIGWEALIPFTPWLLAAQWWWHGLSGWLVFIAVVLSFVVLLLLPATRRLGVDLRFWLLSYGVYLLAVFFPQSSTFRILAPMFPALGIFAVPRSRVFRALLIVLSLIGQWFWIHYMWAVDGYDWSPP